MANYVIGVVLAIISAISNNFGTLFVKIAVNKIPSSVIQADFHKQLIRSPRWWAGLFLQYAVGTIFFMFAVDNIGPSLVPGIMAIGLIVLAIGSIKIIGEKLKWIEFIGIGLLICGTTLLGLSRLAIPSEEVIFSTNLNIRIGIYTAILFIGYFSLQVVSKRINSPNVKGIILAINSGILLSLSNLWISPLMVTIGIIFGSEWDPIGLIYLLLSILILILTNFLSVMRIQESFRRGQASNLIPIQQIPIQLTQILIYFLVFFKSASILSSILITIGVIMIIISGFLLGKRQAEFGSKQSEKEITSEDGYNSSG